MRKVLFLIMFLIFAMGMNAQITTHFTKIDGDIDRFGITNFKLSPISNHPYLYVTNEMGCSIEAKRNYPKWRTITIYVFGCIDKTGRAKHHFVQYLPKNLTGKKIIIKDYVTIGERKMPCITYSSIEY